MTSEAVQDETLHFGGFILDIARGALYRGSEEIHLRPQSYAVLKYLVENPGRLVSKSELLTAVWGDALVTDGSLAQCLIDVRRALGDESHELIRTVPRRGVVLELPVTSEGQPAGAEAIRPGVRRTLGWLLAAASCAAIGIAAWLAAGGLAGEEATGRSPANTVAVLAFADLSEGADHQYFADGVAEEVLNLLARLPELRVVARTSSFSFRERDADVTEIGKALDVAYLLEGSVRRAGQRVRVTAQLVDTASGAHVWSENYDRDLGDLLNVQTDIAGRVARSLEITLSGGALSPGRHAVKPEAHDHFLQAQFLHNRRSPGDLALAVEHYQKALAIDPDYAAAWAGFAGTQLVRIYEDGADPVAGLDAMRVAITRALEIDPTLPEAHLRAAHFYVHAGDWERAAQHHDRAETLGPNSALVLASAAGRASYAGRYEEAAALMKRSVALDPLGAVARNNYARYLALAGRIDDALSEISRAHELSPREIARDPLKPALLVLLGRHEEALAAARALPGGAQRDQVLALAYRGLNREVESRAAFERVANSNHPWRALLLAELHAQSGELDAAFELMPAMQAEFDAASKTPGNTGRAGWIVSRPLLRPLHGDPRWELLVAEVRQHEPRALSP